jgi:hypothetical protein
MKKFSINIIICVTFVMLIAVFFGSCDKKNPEKIREKSEKTKDRYITVINKTGSKLDGYQINTANGIEISKGKTSDNSFSIKIGKGFKNDPEIEVVLADEFERIYVKTFNVPLTGNTDTPVSEKDRKSEGPMVDKYKDLTAWLNKHK